MRPPSLVVAALAVALLAGCPAPAPGASAVRAGQRWRFRLGGLPGAEQAYEVTEVTSTAVLFDARTFAGGEALGPPLPQAFPLSPAPAPLEDGAPGPPLVVSGLRLDTWVATRGGERVTTAVTGRAPTFPGVVRVERDGEVVLELTGVE